MNDKLSIHKKVQSTTLLREWTGLTGIFIWFFCALYNFEDTLFSVERYICIFTVALTGTMLVLGFRYGDKVALLAKISCVTVPMGALCTTFMYILPSPFYKLLYMLSPIFMAPLILRRIYGLVQMAGENRRFRMYMSAISTTVVFHSLWSILPLSYAIRFPIIALFSLIGLWGVTRELTVKQQFQLLPTALTVKTTASVLGLFILLNITNFFYELIHSYFIFSGLDDKLWMWFGGTIIPAIGFLLFAFFADYKREKLGFIFGISLALLGLILAFIPSESMFVVPLMITDGLGGTFTEYFILSFSLYFINTSRRPILMASLGFILNFIPLKFFLQESPLVSKILTSDGITPELVVCAAISSLLLMVMVLYTLEREKEKNLILTILNLTQVDGSAETTTPPLHRASPPAPPIPISKSPALEEAGLSDLEKKIASLLCEGLTQGEIAHKLHLHSSEVNDCLKGIRTKISDRPFPENYELITAIGKDYDLTAREVQMLRCLSMNKTNAEIASELFISDATVRFHIRNLLKKLSISSRYDVIQWLRNFEEKQ